MSRVAPVRWTDSGVKRSKMDVSTNNTSGIPADSSRRSLLRQTRSRQTRENIVRAAGRLWAERGFDAITVTEICDAAGVGRTTYYLHFESKEQLLGELTWLTAAGVAHEVDDALQEPGLDHHLEVFVAGVARRVSAMPRNLAAQVLEAAMPGVARLGHFPDGRVDFGRLLSRIFQTAQANGELEPHIDPDELGAILGGMTMEGLIRWATGYTGAHDLQEVLQLRAELILDGLRTGRRR